MHERNTLMKQAYPKVKAHCRKIGYEFQVVDMRWGVRDEATDDHMGTELCLKELKLCQKLSTGPNFVVRSSIILNVWQIKIQKTKQKKTKKKKKKKQQQTNR